MKGLKLIVLSSLALSIVSPVLNAQQPKKTWWQRHGAKIKAGIGIAALAGITLGLAYHGNKTKAAVDKAEISDSEEYGWAIAVVGLLGPLGPDRALWLIKQAVDRNVITPKDATLLIFSSTGDALAHYYGMSPVVFKAKAAGMGLKGLVSEAWHEAKENAQKSFKKFKEFVRGKV